jgi:hypothetical protein
LLLKGDVAQADGRVQLERSGRCVAQVGHRRGLPRLDLGALLIGVGAITSVAQSHTRQPLRVHQSVHPQGQAPGAKTLRLPIGAAATWAESCARTRALSDTGATGGTGGTASGWATRCSVDSFWML